MFCDNCGCEIAPEVKICPVCGKKVEDMNPAGITDAGTIEDVSTTADDKAETADVMKQASDIEKNLSDAADKESADVIDTDDMELLLSCEPLGIIKKNNIDELIGYASEKKAVQFTAYLLEYKESHFKKGKNALDSLKL